MLHATFFHQGGTVSYLNRFVHTQTYAVEKAEGKRVWMPVFEGDIAATCFSFLFNFVRFYSGFKTLACSSSTSKLNVHALAQCKSVRAHATCL